MRTVFLALALVLSSVCAAGTVTVPNSFQPNTPALASEVNANFQALVDAVNAQQATIDQLQTQLAAANATINQLQSDLNTAQAGINNNATGISSNTSLITTNTNGIDGNAVDIASNANAIGDIQSNTVLALDGFLTRETDLNGYETARFDSINVQVTNGLGATNGNPDVDPIVGGPVNGLGNLIVGYNDVWEFALIICSKPGFLSESQCTSNGGIWGNNQRSGSHNLVVGAGHSYTNHGGLIAGQLNGVNAISGSVSGGVANTASGQYSSVSGGGNHIASGDQSSVSGGLANTASGGNSSISGGEFRIADTEREWTAGNLPDDS